MPFIIIDNITAMENLENPKTMKHGRPFAPGNRFGRGRPPGSRNKRSRKAQDTLDAFGDKVISKALTIGLQGKGNSTMIRTLVPHVVSRRKDAPIRLPRMPLRTLEDLDQASEAVLKRVFAGKIGPVEAQIISEIIDKRRHVIETRDLDRRLRVLEAGKTLPSKPDSSEPPVEVPHSVPPVAAPKYLSHPRGDFRNFSPDVEGHLGNRGHKPVTD